MQFFKDLLRNLGLLLIIVLALYVLFPGTMRQVLEVYGGLFGPLAILVFIIAALPRRRRGRG